MCPRLSSRLAAVLLCLAAALPAAAVADPACVATAKRAPTDPRLRLAIQEAMRQHVLFGGQTIERNGGLFVAGYHEAEWAVPPGETAPTWERVATFWRALAEGEPGSLNSSAGRVARPAAVGNQEGSRLQVATREALLRAAIVDTPWSAAFISHLMKAAGFSREEFVPSDSHADYVQAALDATAAEREGREAAHAFRACDVATTRPRAGDLLCATRASTAGTAKFDQLPAAMAARRAAGQPFPMHCDLVVRSDEGGDAKLETVGGNVFNSVTLSRMTLNAAKVLSDGYIAGASRPACEPGARGCRGHLSRRPWVVVLQFRH